MNKLTKRIEKLENILTTEPMRIVRIIQNIGETEEQALEKEGITDLENIFLIIRKIIDHKPRAEDEI